jgi:phosphoglycolate phosphatase-like HAD superfamily hydrolase
LSESTNLFKRNDMTADRGPLTGHPAGEQPLVECGKCSMPPEAVGDALADAYNALHDEELSMFPDAHETLDRLKELGVKLSSLSATLVRKGEVRT